MTKPRARASGAPDRPIGVVVICTLTVIGNGLTLLFTLIGLAMTPDLVAALALVGIPIGIYVVTNLVVPALSLAAVHGLWKLERWGWRLGATMAMLNLSTTGLALVTRAAVDLDGSSTVPYTAIIVPLVTVVYLMRTKIIELYGWLDHEAWTVRAGVLAVGFLASVVFILALPRSLQGT